MYKKWTLHLFFYGLFSLSSVIVINYLFDPLQQYRAASFYKPHFTNARYLNPGLAKSYKYDSILVGSSMSQNFIISDVKRILGYDKPIKFTPAGTTAHENKLILDVALSRKQTQHVLYNLDFYAFSGKPTRLLLGDGSVPKYLYDNNYFNDYRYLLNIDTLKKIFKTTILNLTRPEHIELKYNRMYQWIHHFNGDNYNEDRIWDMWNKNEGILKNGFKEEDYSFTKMTLNFNQNLLSLIDKNSEVKFDIFYPPYSVLAMKESQNKRVYKSNMKFKEYIAKKLSDYPNVTIHDFNNDFEVTTNLSNYRDFTHYHHKINIRILEKIKTKEFVVNNRNYKQYQTDLDNMIKRFSSENKMKILQINN